MALSETAKLVAALELQDKFSGPARSAEAALGRLEGKATTLGRVGSEAGRGLATGARNVAVIGTAAVLTLSTLIGKSIQDASQLEQATGAIESVFGKAAGAIEDFADTAAESTGLSRRAVKEMGAVIGAQLQGMGFAADEAARKTIELEERAADMAATFGGTTVDAIQAITALMRGERDPIERYGVSLKAADVKARILALGLDTSTTAAKKNAEAVAGLQLLMEATAKTEGQFARESDTLAGTQQRLQANFENTRAIVGGVLLPQVAKLAERLNSALTDNLPAIETLAGKLPGIFDKLLGIVENLPWDSIGTAFKLMGTGAEAALNLFAGAPDWLQTAVLTGWGLNKLTGGALGNIVGALGSGLIKGVLGMQAGVVNIQAGVVNGGGGGVPAGGGGGGLLGGLRTGVALASPLLAGAAAVEVINFDNMRNEQKAGLQSIVDELPRRTGAEIDESIARLQGEINAERPLLEGIIFNTNIRPQLEAELRELQQQRAAAAQHARAHAQAVREGAFSQINEFRRASNERRGEANQQRSVLERARAAVDAGRAATERGFGATTGLLSSQNSKLGGILAKRSSVTVNATIPVSVNISAVQVAYNLQHLRQTTNSGGFI